MALQQITPAAAEPIHLADALAQIRQYAGADDARVLASITAARSMAENKTWRQMLGARYRQTFDGFCAELRLDRAPVQAIESITYTDMAGVVQPVSAAAYIADTTSDPCRIRPAFGAVWPPELPQINAVTVTFIAGYAAPMIADATANTITVKGAWKPLAVGDVVRLTNSGGSLPAPLQLATDYHIASAEASGVYTLSATANGSAINLTDAGTGQTFFGEIPGDILAWMRLQIGSMDQFRESEAVGSVSSLRFTDGLIDAYAPWW